MKKAVTMPAVGDVAALIDFAVELEETGWDGVFLWDHLQFLPEKQLRWMDPWVVLGAIGTKTARVRIGTMVTPISRRRPWKLAKEAITLDHLTGGRVTLGIGLGAPEQDEFTAFGETAEPRQRAERTDESLQVLDRILRGERVEHSGKHYDVHAHLQPASLQSPRLPIWIAATPPFRRPVDRAAKWDGVFCNLVTTGTTPSPMTPGQVQDYLGDLLDREDFEVGTPRHPDYSLDDYEAVGVSWVRESRFPGPNWIAELREHLRTTYS